MGAFVSTLWYNCQNSSMGTIIVNKNGHIFWLEGEYPDSYYETGSSKLGKLPKITDDKVFSIPSPCCSSAAASGCSLNARRSYRVYPHERSLVTHAFVQQEISNDREQQEIFFRNLEELFPRLRCIIYCPSVISERNNIMPEHELVRELNFSECDFEAPIQYPESITYDKIQVRKETVENRFFSFPRNVETIIFNSQTITRDLLSKINNVHTLIANKVISNVELDALPISLRKLELNFSFRRSRAILIDLNNLPLFVESVKITIPESKPEDRFGLRCIVSNPPATLEYVVCCGVIVYASGELRDELDGLLRKALNISM